MRTGQHATPESEAARPSAPHAQAPAPTTRPRHGDEPEDRASTGDDADNGTDDRSADPTDDGTDDHGAADDTTTAALPTTGPGPRTTRRTTAGAAGRERADRAPEPTT